MSKLSFIFRTDVHTADASPASWKGDYPAEIWESLRQIGEFAHKYGAAAVLDGGDYFHVKAPTRNSHRLVAKSAAIQNTYPCPTYCVEGNHDVKHNNLDTLADQPLGVLYESGVFQHLRETVFESEGLKVRVVGFPYKHDRSLEELRSYRKAPGEYLVAVVHALAGENPPDHVEEFFGEPVFRYKDLVYEGGPDVYCFGHWHQDQGIVQLGGCYFVNQGSVSRGSLTKENLNRTPKVALLEFTPSGVTVSSLPLKVAPAAEVFDLERKERQDQEARTIEQFVEVIKDNIVLSDTDGASVEKTISSLGFANSVGALARDYLQRARSEK